MSKLIDITTDRQDMLGHRLAEAAKGDRLIYQFNQPCRLYALQLAYAKPGPCRAVQKRQGRTP